MEVSQNSGIQADSTAQQSGTLILSRTTLDFSGADAFRVDSSRLQAKKTTTPIIKTIPYIPENDSVSHPVYDVLNGEFVITPDESLISHLRLNPIEPVSSDAQAIQSVSPQQIPVKQGNSELLRQVKSAPASELLTDDAANKPTEVVLVDTVTIADTNNIAADSVFIADSLAASDSATATKPAPEHKIYEEKEGKPLMRKTYGFSIDKSDTNTDWMIGVIITSFIFLAWARMIYGKFVGMVFQAAVNFFAANRIYNESNVVRGRVFAMLNLLFYANTSLFFCQSADFYNINIFTASIISFTWIAFSILIGQFGSLGFHYCRGSVVFGSNHFNMFFLTAIFLLDGSPQLWVNLGYCVVFSKHFCSKSYILQKEK